MNIKKEIIAEMIAYEHIIPALYDGEIIYINNKLFHRVKKIKLPEQLCKRSVSNDLADYFVFCEDEKKQILPLDSILKEYKLNEKETWNLFNVNNQIEMNKYIIEYISEQLNSFVYFNEKDTIYHLNNLYDKCKILLPHFILSLKFDLLNISQLIVRYNGDLSKIKKIINNESFEIIKSSFLYTYSDIDVFKNDNDDFFFHLKRLHCKDSYGEAKSDMKKTTIESMFKYLHKKDKEFLFFCFDSKISYKHRASNIEAEHKCTVLSEFLSSVDTIKKYEIDKDLFELSFKDTECYFPHERATIFTTDNYLFIFSPERKEQRIEPIDTPFAQSILKTSFEIKRKRFNYFDKMRKTSDMNLVIVKEDCYIEDDGYFYTHFKDLETGYVIPAKTKILKSGYLSDNNSICVYSSLDFFGYYEDSTETTVYSSKLIKYIEDMISQKIKEVFNSLR